MKSLAGCEVAYSRILKKLAKGRTSGNNLAISQKEGGVMGKEKQAVKKENPSVTDPEIVQDEIRALAYQLFCEGGCGHGRDVEHWVEAERRVLERYESKTPPRG